MERREIQYNVQVTKLLTLLETNLKSNYLFYTYTGKRGLILASCSTSHEPRGTFISKMYSILTHFKSRNTITCSEFVPISTVH
jgi:hypothetical protein